MSLPIDQVSMLRHAILFRKGAVCHFVDGEQTGQHESLEEKLGRILTKGQ